MEIFHYENLVSAINQVSSIENNYTADKTREFLILKFLDPTLEGHHEGKVKRGWKLHISIDDTVDGNLERAWNILVESLIRYRIAYAKVITPGQKPLHRKPVDSFLQDAYGHLLKVSQAGKQITIYACRQPNLNWNNFVDEVTQNFTREVIRPSCKPFSDKSVPGNPYFSYRNDADLDNEYMRSTGYSNPYGHKKIFKFEKKEYGIMRLKWEDVVQETKPNRPPLEELGLRKPVLLPDIPEQVISPDIPEEVILPKFTDFSMGRIEESIKKVENKKIQQPHEGDIEIPPENPIENTSFDKEEQLEYNQLSNYTAFFSDPAPKDKEQNSNCCTRCTLQ